MADTEHTESPKTEVADPESPDPGSLATGSLETGSLAPESSEPRASEPGSPEAGSAGPAEHGESPAPARPTLSAFAAAIERKKAAGQARSAHLDGVAKVGGATSSHKTSRTFRRKSG